MTDSKTTELISVLLPTYNPDLRYFNKCIESVLNQSYTNFELIISDDSPTTIVTDFLQKYNDPRIRFFKNKKGKGIFQNLNHAIGQADGAFLQIFCQDDYMYEGLLTNQLRALNENPKAGFVYAQYDAVNEKDEMNIPCHFSGNKQDEIFFVPQQKATNLFFKYGCLPGNLSTVMLRKKVIEEQGLFSEDYPYVGDFKCWVDITKRHGFAIVRPPMLAVRTHSQQASHTMGGIKWIEEVLPIYQQLYREISIGESRRMPRLFINEKMGVQGFYLILKSMVLSKKPALLKKLRLLNQAPFKLWLIVVLFVVTLRQKIKFFQLDNVILFED
ncbi:MAG: glycosyltransferase [Bacteroidota bacterium]